MKFFKDIPHHFSKVFVLIWTFTAVWGYAQAPCTTVISTTDVTCPGGKDGTVQITTYGPDGQEQTGFCRAPMPSPYTCANIGCTRTVTTNTAFEVSEEEIVCVQVANFNQNITFNGGGHIVFCVTAAPQNINFNGNILSCKITVLSGANVNFNTLNNIANSEMYNYGTITFNATGYNGRLENFGTIIVNSTANINATQGYLINNGIVQIQGSFNIYNNVDNYGTMTVAQDLNVNTNSGFRNFCTLNVTGNITISPSNNPLIPDAVSNYGKITVGQQTIVNGSAKISMQKGSYWDTKSLMLNGTIQGPSSPSCAKFNVQANGQITVNADGVISDIGLCYPGSVTKSGPVPAAVCTCTISDPPTITWISTPNIGVIVDRYKTIGLAAGTYNLQIKIPGCNSNNPYSKSFTINQPAPILITESSVNTLYTVTATGGTAPLTYTWSDGTVGNTHILLVGQSLDVTVTDSRGCSKTKTITNTNTNGCNLVLTPTSVACGSNPTGRIDVAVTGASSYTLYMNDQVVTSPITGLAPGNYTVYLQAANCNRASQTTVQLATTALKADVIPIGDQALATGTGGTQPYSYLWSDGNVNSLRTLAIGQTYTVKVTDAAGCSDSKSITKLTPSCLNLWVLKEEVACGGNAVPSAEVFVSGGSGSYNYKWSYNNANTAKVTGLPPGDYTVVVTDNENPDCVSGLPVHIEYIGSSIKVTHSIVGQTASLAVSGGNAPYTYTWEHGPASQKINLPEFGIYTVIVTDQSGCTGKDTLDYSKSCLGFKAEALIEDSKASIEVTGGQLPYTYLWSPNAGETRSEVPNLPNGTYKVAVIDASTSKCRDSVIFTISSCGRTVSHVVTASCADNNLCNGSAVVNVTPNTGITYLWSNGQTGPSASQLCAGTQWVKIKVPSCGTLYRSIQIPVKTAGCDKDQCNFNLALNKAQHFSCFDAHDAYIDISVTGTPKRPLDFKWTYPNQTIRDAVSEDLLTIPTSGTYTLTATDGVCIRDISVSITGPTASLSTQATATSVSCYGGSDGNVQVTYAGGMGTAQISWRDGVVAGFFRGGLSPGTYGYTLTDANGCQVSGSTRVEEPQSDAPKIHPSSRFICLDAVPASAVVLTATTVSGYGPYVWTRQGDPTFNAMGNTITVSQPGIYKLTVGKVGCASLISNIRITGDSCEKPTTLCNPIIINDVTMPEVDKCAQRLDVVYTNAVNRYNAYIEYEKVQFKEQYIAKCLSSLNEKLTMQYDNKEYHYTLYYHDQAGNLTRTVPPAGVVPLTPAEINIVKSDKASGVKTLFTKHTLASTYQFNTFNAQIKADIPDHERQPVWELESVTSLPDNANVEATHITRDDKGFLISNENNIGYIYTAGVNNVWQKLDSIGLPDLYDVQWLDNNRAVAVGNEGLFLETSDGGVTWKYRGLPGARSYRKIASAGNTLYVFDTQGNFNTLTHTGGQWELGTTLGVALATSSGGAGLRDVHATSASRLYAITNSTGGPSRIFYSTNSGSSWTEITNNVTMPATSSLAVSSGQVATTALIGSNHYLQVSNDAGNQWQFMTSDATLSSTLPSKMAFEGSSMVSVLSGGQLYRYKTGDAYNITAPSNPFTSGTVADIASRGSKFIALSTQGQVRIGTSGGSLSAAVSVSSSLGSPSGVNFYSETVGAVYGNGLYITTNGGTNWSADLRANTNIGSTTTKITSNISFAHFSNANQGIVLTGNLLYYRQLSGSNYIWSQVRSDVKYVAFDPTTASIGCLVTTSGAIFTSSNGGQSWSSTSLTVPSALNTQIRQLAFADSKVYLTLPSGILVGNLSNNTWLSTTGRINLPQLNAIDVLNPSGSTYIGYAVGGIGTALKTTDGANWQWVPSRMSQSLNDVTQNTGQVFVLDAQGAVWRGTSSTAPSVMGTGTLGSGAEITVNGNNLAALGTLGSSSSSLSAGTASSLTFTASPDPSGAFRAVSINTEGRILMAGKHLYIATVANTTVPALRNVHKFELLQDASLESNGNKAFIVGHKGTVLASSDTGATWRSQTISTTASPLPDLLAVASENDNAVAVGKNGFIIETGSGDVWQTRTVSGLTQSLNAVAIRNGNVLAVGDNGTLARKLGSGTWESPTTTGIPTVALHSVTFADQALAFIGGANGTLLRCANVTASTLAWTKLEKTAGVNWTSALIKALYFKDRLTGYAFCDNGTVLKTTDGGDYWELSSDKSLETTESINAVSTVAGTDELTVSGNGGTSWKLKDQSDLFTTRHWYDEMGRLLISQNAKQFDTQSFSYNVYDGQNRIIEVGEIKLNDAAIRTMNGYTNHSQLMPNSLYSRFWLYSGTKSQITKTYYSKSVISRSDFPQENLRKRIGSITYQDEAGTGYDHATHYSYDPHGNVSRVLQDNPHLPERRYALIEYEYDLVAGKVNQLAYQKGKADAFYHRYQYDADNRIISVETSTDGLKWKSDAKYTYHAHGPLARTILGDDTVQTMNYAYTLQGWVKAMNAGQFSYSLGYHTDDYSAIGAISHLPSPVAKPLYNGNIATMSSKTLVPSWSNFNNAVVQQFDYDQLHRLTTTTVQGANKNYKTAYSYDANGNILTLGRYNEVGTQFDTLTYRYENKANNLAIAPYQRNTNKLRWVDDAAGASVHDADIDDQAVENYSYDALGNLVADKQENIAKIEWNVYGKIQKITCTPGQSDPDMEFRYDALGHRTEKIVKGKMDGLLLPTSEWTHTYYVRDVQGYVLSTYSRVGERENNKPLLLKEQHLYGAMRLGMYKPDLNLATTSTFVKQQKLGVKEYELGDHLNNVRLVLSDRRTAPNQGEVLSANDYYAFGMMMPMRKFNSNAYRYGYNGMEMDNEVRQGDGNSYTTEFRQYDARLGKWLSMDPLFTKYPSCSPYNAFLNSPLINIDVNGKEAIVIHANSPDEAEEIIFDDDNIVVPRPSPSPSPPPTVSNTEVAPEGIYAPEINTPINNASSANSSAGLVNNIIIEPILKSQAAQAVDDLMIKSRLLQTWKATYDKGVALEMQSELRLASRLRNIDVLGKIGKGMTGLSLLTNVYSTFDPSVNTTDKAVAGTGAVANFLELLGPKVVGPVLGRASVLTGVGVSSYQLTTTYIAPALDKTNYFDYAVRQGMEIGQFTNSDVLGATVTGVVSLPIVQIPLRVFEGDFGFSK